MRSCHDRFFTDCWIFQTTIKTWNFLVSSGTKGVPARVALLWIHLAVSGKCGWTMLEREWLYQPWNPAHIVGSAAVKGIKGLREWSGGQGRWKAPGSQECLWLVLGLGKFTEHRKRHGILVERGWTKRELELFMAINSLPLTASHRKPPSLPLPSTMFHAILFRHRLLRVIRLWLDIVSYFLWLLLSRTQPYPFKAVLMKREGK